MALGLAMPASANISVPLFDIPSLEQAVSVHSTGFVSQVTTLLGYDALGRPAAFTNAAGQAFRLAWDAQGRLLAATNALGEEVQRLAYDAAGNLVERVDGAGRSAVFAYDPLNRATNALYADGTNLTFSFDAAGSLTRAVGPGATNTFGYGADGALAASTCTAGGVTFEVHYLRDVAGNVTNLVYPDGRRVAYDYDAENRLAEMRDWNGRAYRFVRDGAGRMTEVSFPNGVTNSWTRDQAGRVTGWRYEKSGTALVERNFTLDAVGRILEADYAVGPQPVFPAARRLDFAHNAADRITASGVYSGTNVESTAWLYDGAGAVTNGGGRSYAYRARGLLERAWGTNVDFEAGYDALGNRIWERSGGVERRFAVDHADPFKRPLVETDASGVVVRRYVWGPDRLLAVEEADGTLRVALTDERGSVAGLTDASGALMDTFVYGPYGEDWGRTGTNALAFRWLGGYGVRHAGGSLYVTRFRAYDTDARRFLSADPLWLAGGGNLYAYGAGDPMFFIDPLGLEAEANNKAVWFGLEDMMNLPEGEWSYVRPNTPWLHFFASVANTIPLVRNVFLPSLDANDPLAPYIATTYFLGPEIGLARSAAYQIFRSTKLYSAAEKTTTVLGSGADVAPYANKPGFNVLEIDRSLPLETRKSINRQWLDAAIDRGDDILLKTDPIKWDTFMREIGKESFYNEVELPRLLERGVINDTILGY
jgi:RHS repeat-associated protein